MKFTEKLLEKILVVMVALTAAAAFTDDSEMSSGEVLDANELPTNTADFEKVSRDGKVFEELESLSERKKRCRPTILCTHAGGQCVKSRAECNGVLDPSGCKGGKKCKCCITNLSTPAATTCPDVTCPATTPCPTTTPMTYTTPIPTATEAPTTTPIPTTTAALTTAPGCPLGFFQTNDAGPCYKLFNNTAGNWANADKTCRDEGLLVAKTDTDPVATRRYLVETYGLTRYTMVGAKGDGSYMRWQRNNGIIPQTSSYWYYYNAGSNYCLVLLTHPSDMNSKPSSPFYPIDCTHSWNKWTLCEKV